MDTTRRNNLLYLRILKNGTLELKGAQADALKDLFNGESVPVRSLAPHEAENTLLSKLKEISRKAKSNLDEKGLQTLFLAYGTATWPSKDENRPPEAAIVLLPLRIDAKSTGGNPRVQSVGPPQVNMVLLHALKEEHGVKVTEEDLIPPGSLDVPFSTDSVKERLAAAARQIAHFSIADRALIGNFSFQKLAMIRDLTELGSQLVGHDMVAALSGDSEARLLVGARSLKLDPSSLDQSPPQNEYLVLDADSSQQAAVHAIVSGSDGVIQGPPGCGKSQTIANAITSLVAKGKRVLFVAEKRAALEAVHKRLRERDLGHLALDMHGADVSQRSALDQVAKNLERLQVALEPDCAQTHRDFEEKRTRLVRHVKSLHNPLEPSGKSPFELQAGLIESSRTAPSQTRWRGADLNRLTANSYLVLYEATREAAGLASLVSRKDQSPWTDAEILTGHEAQEALDAARALNEQHLPKLMAALDSLSQETGFSLRTLKEAEQAVRLLGEVHQILRDWTSAVFSDCPSAADLHRAAQGPLPLLWAHLFNPNFRRARRQMISLSKRGALTTQLLWESCSKVEGVRAEWQAASRGSTAPHRLDLAPELEALVAQARSHLAILVKTLPALADLPIEQIHASTNRMWADDATAHLIPRVRALEAMFKDLGAEAFLHELRLTETPPEAWQDMFQTAYFQSCYDAARSSLPNLGGFRGEEHSQAAASFRRLDQERLAVAALRVARKHAEQAVAAMNEHPEQKLLLKGEAAKREPKRGRRLTLRQLLDEAGDVLTAVCPCWMSSPLNVSQLIPGDRQLFDVVIFDEASQVLPEDAICSVVRAKKLVVTGDRHQLPPTAFFADGAGEDEGDEGASDYESLLDQISAFMDHWPLDWHYRSEDERLIAFSNAEIYKRLITFPGVGRTSCLSHILVNSLPRDGQEKSCAEEVERVVQLILDHAEAQLRRKPDSWESLGVIAMGLTHADRIQAGLDQALKSRPDLERFVSQETHEPFFIKNLERVQGDERDVIVLTIGYGKDAKGKLPYQFGPLLQRGGERRLNVAITRAKKRMIVVSSFSHLDMDPRRSKSKGVELLRGFLQFAASGGTTLGDKGGAGARMNGFESDIYDVLSSRGIALIPQYGVSGYRLDFAAFHPEREGEPVLAIECDGASYHSAQTARDRDRLRQQQLERLGWKFHRIWSTDWFLRREEQIERAVAAWKDAVEASDAKLRAETDGDLGGLFAQPDEEEDVPDQQEEPPPKPQRQPLRNFRFYQTIEQYSHTELVRLVKWIGSDGVLRTDDDILREAIWTMGFKRRGARIVQAIEAAIRAAKG